MSDRPDMLLWIDIETTGLETGADDILEIGMIITDETASREEERLVRLVNPGSVFLTKDNLTAIRMHTDNGLLEEALNAPLPEHSEEATALILRDWLTRASRQYTLHAAGTNIRHFDLPMLQTAIADTIDGFTIDGHLHHRDMDMSALRRLDHSLGHDPYTNHKGTHRVVDCLTRDIAEYRRYRRILDAGYDTLPTADGTRGRRTSTRSSRS